MSRATTVLIRETDDDRTVIDPVRLSGAKAPFEGSGQAVQSAGRSSSLGEPAAGAPLLRRRRMIEGGIALGVVLGLSSIAYQQWRAADALRAAIGEMKSGRPTASLGDPGERLAAGVPSVGAERSLEAPTHAAAVDDREQLERRGASLLGSNDFTGALSHYQTLADLFPNQPVFRDVVTVLKAKLRCLGPTESASRGCP